MDKHLANPALTSLILGDEIISIITTKGYTDVVSLW